MARVNVELFVEMLNKFFSSSAITAEEVAGGHVSFFQGGHTTSIPVHVQVTLNGVHDKALDGESFYFSFAAETPLSIDKRLFDLQATATTEEMIKSIRGQFVKQMIGIAVWQLRRIKEGVDFKFSYGRCSVQNVSETSALQRPTTKPATQPALQRPTKLAIQPALQRPTKRTKSN
ncbi:hypothetical protein BH10CYA1_BH10CYA1_53470 [soil metagenome]